MEIKYEWNKIAKLIFSQLKDMNKELFLVFVNPLYLYAQVYEFNSYSSYCS